MKYPTLDDISVSGKRILVRADLNSEVNGGKIIAGPRIKASAETLKELAHKKAKVVVLAHQGRNGDADFTDLKQHARLLNKYVKIKFVPDIIGRSAVTAIAALKNGEVLLLDNVRSLPDEMKPSLNNAMVRALAPLFDLYVNDAFSVSHREQTSIVSFPKILPSYAGRLLQHELASIEELQTENALYILGGSKEENIKLMRTPGRIIATCGVFGQLCLIARGFYFGAQNKFLEKEIISIVPRLKPIMNLLPIETPIDFAIRDAKGKRENVDLSEFPLNYEIYDVGPKTQKRYIQLMKQSPSILLKGTAGYCEEKQFSQGTHALLKTMAASKAFTVLGGGHTTSALQKFKISQNKFDYVSLSGGAFVSYLAGEQLPGLDALQRGRKNEA